MNATQIDVTAIVGTYGLAVALIIILVLFAIFKVWPLYTERLKKGDGDRQQRHSEYIGAVNRATDVMEKVTQILAASKERDDAHALAQQNGHNEVIGVIRGEVITRLDKINDKIPNGFGSKRD